MPADDYLIRRFADARDQGNMAAAMAFWEEACTRSVDIARYEIRRFRFPGTTTPLKEQDHGEALTRALERMLKMGHGFHGRTGAEFRAAVLTAAFRGCQDVGREEMNHEMRSGGSFDVRNEDGDGSPFDAMVESYLKDQEVQAEEAEEADAERERAISLVHWAIRQVDNPNYRAVLELTYIDKLTGEQIAQRLGITVANVYQRRTRGLNELEKILRDHRS